MADEQARVVQRALFGAMSASKCEQTGSVSTIAVLMARVMEHITLVGPLTYELSHAPFPSEGSHGIKGNTQATFAPSTNSQRVLQESVAMYIAYKQED